jgi:hypothetical protein
MFGTRHRHGVQQQVAADALTPVRWVHEEAVKLRDPSLGPQKNRKAN